MFNATLVYLRPPENLNTTERGLDLFENRLDREEGIVKRLVDLGGNVIVDNVHYNDTRWLNQFKEGLVKAYSVDGREVSINGKQKSFVAYFLENEKLPRRLHWERIAQCIRGGPVPKCLLVTFSEERVPTPIPFEEDPNVITRHASKKEWDVYKEVLENKQVYRLKEMLVPELDTMLYEMIRPNEETPYTLSVRRFSEKGRKAFFTGFFVVDGFGDCTVDGIDDRKFLRYMWGEWGMEGEFDLDEMRKEAMESYHLRLLDGVMIAPNAEPVVYRKNLNDVKKFLLNKFSGC